MREKLRQKLDGFSLIEISIVLLIIGIIAGATLKGVDVLDGAKIKSVASDIHTLQMKFAEYNTTFGALPGDDKDASTRFGGALKNGNGDGKISEEEAKQVLIDLNAAGLIDSPSFKAPKIGGTYEVISEADKAKVTLSTKLSRKQVLGLKAKLTELLGEKNAIVETDPQDFSDDKQKYTVKVPLN